MPHKNPQLEELRDRLTQKGATLIPIWHAHRWPKDDFQMVTEFEVNYDANKVPHGRRTHNSIIIMTYGLGNGYGYRLWLENANREIQGDVDRIIP